MSCLIKGQEKMALGLALGIGPRQLVHLV